MFSRTRWVAHLLNRDLSAVHSDEPGLVILQIDGLARSQLDRAIADGRMPFLRKLLKSGHFEQLSFYSGLPSTTPAVQAEVMFGAKCAVPAFQFLNRESGKTVLMYEQEWAKAVSEKLAKNHQPLLEGGRSYSNIYAAGAAEARLCAETMDLAKLTEMTRLWKLGIVVVLYLFTVLRVIALAILEFFIAVIDLIYGLAGQQHWRAELSCIFSRVGVSIVMREWLCVVLKLAIEEGSPIIYGNFLGYDEQAHRRGPQSKFAHWGLKGIDDMIRQVFRAAHRSDLRDYEVVIFSDHGQQHTRIYENETGNTIQAAVTRAFKAGPLSGRSVRGLDEYGAHGPETDQRGRRLLRVKRGRLNPPQASVEELANDIIITALGPLGHVYLPIELSDEEKSSYARVLVDDEKVPLVFFRNRQGVLIARNPQGEWRLPDDTEQIFGHDHPFLSEAAPDLLRLANHPDAGDLIISGWTDKEMPTTFVHENGAHGSIGSEETRGFALVPYSLHLNYRQATNNERYIRGVDIYRSAWQFVHPNRPLRQHQELDPQASDQTLKPAPCHRPQHAMHHAGTFSTAPVIPQSLRVMTYNVHSCIGIDGKVRPERIISVIRSCAADIVALQEVDANHRRSRGHEQARMIASALSMSHHYYAISDWNAEQYGLAIISRLPLEHIQSGHLTPANHSNGCEARGALWVRLKTDLGFVNVLNTHFGLRREERARQAHTLLGSDWLGQIPEQEPIILCGDFNTGPKSPIVKGFSPKLVDVHLRVPHIRPRATFVSFLPLRRLDYIFTSQHFEVAKIMQPRTPTAKVASDHLPVVAQLTLPA